MIEAIHLSDTHIGPTADAEVHGINTLDRLEALIAKINALDFSPDLIVHSGDITNQPSPEAYAVAAEAFSKLEAPIYFVTGNHDDASLIRQHLTAGPSVNLVDDPDRLATRIDLPGLRLFLLDAKVPEEEGPHGSLPENQLAALESELSQDAGPFAIFVHFPPFPIGSPWIDRHLPLANGMDLHALLVRVGVSRNRGVFFGHLHRGLQLYRDGILYSGVSSSAFVFTAGPRDETITWETDCPLAFNHLSFSEHGTSVKEYQIV